MKTGKFWFVSALLLVINTSCNEPETVVTNIINADGSVTRKLEMRNSSKSFEPKSLQVPVDSTWSVTDSLEINEKGDTTWVKRAEKLYRNIDEINAAYRNDSSFNRKTTRQADFKKKFRWFSTLYRFSETIEKRLSNGYPLSDFLNEEELLWYYSPGYWAGTDINGPDSVRYKTLQDSINLKEESWFEKSLVSEWIHEFDAILRLKNEDSALLDRIGGGEQRMVEIVSRNEEYFDSLWSAGFILREFLGDSLGLKYQAEADSAVEITLDRFMEDFKEYSFRVSMPGKVTGSNGFPDSSRIMLWPVRSELFMAEPYEMWAESRVTNKWAWIVSALFILFVITGMLINKKRKAENLSLP